MLPRKRRVFLKSRYIHIDIFPMTIHTTGTTSSISDQEVASDVTFLGIEELFKKKEDQFNEAMDDMLHAFVGRLRGVFEEELATLLRKECIRLFKEFATTGLQTTDIAILDQRSLEIISEMMSKIVQEVLKNLVEI
ncbi:MAG: hypothetical protein ACTJLK_02970 [Anaplasma sp.]